jgi:topoisomerase-4 subunit A
VDFKEGFAGYELRNAEFVESCSDIDNVMVVRKDGTFFVTKVAPKFYIGKNVIYVGVVKKGDTSTVYNMAYFDGKSGYTYVKRFKLGGITRDKEYNLTQGNPNSRILYFSATKGEAERVLVKLKPKPRLKKKEFEFDFSSLPVRNRNAQGVILTKHAVHKIILKDKGEQTVGVKLWFDWTVKRLKNSEADQYLGEFTENDRILVITKRGTYYLAPPDLSHHFPDDVLKLEKFDPEQIYNVVYFNAEQGYYYFKRFKFEPSETQVSFIGEHPNSFLLDIAPGDKVLVKVIFGGKDKKREPEVIDAQEFIKVKSVAARGKRLTTRKVAAVEFIIVEPEEQTDEQKEQTLYQQLQKPVSSAEASDNKRDIPDSSTAKESEDAAQEQQNDDDVDFEVKLPDGSQLKIDD